jgi:hypothetical protein
MSRALHKRWRHGALPFDLKVLVDQLDDPEAQPAAGEAPRAETIAAAAVRRRREVAFLANELFNQSRAVADAVSDLVPAELAAGAGDLGGNPPLGALAERLDEALRCFDRLQEELGLPLGREPRYRRFLGGGDDGES